MADQPLFVGEHVRVIKDDLSWYHAEGVVFLLYPTKVQVEFVRRDGSAVYGLFEYNELERLTP